MQSLNLNWLDMAIIIILGLGAFAGYRRGLIVTIFNTLGIVVALALAKFITAPISTYLIENTSIYESILGRILEKIDTLNPMTLSAFRIVNVEQGTAAEVLAGTVISVIVFLGAFLIALIVVSLVKHTLKAIVDRTPIGVIDKLGGMVIGFAASALLIFIFFAVTAPFSGVVANGDMLLDAIAGSRLARYCYLYNPIIPWIENISHI